MSSGTAKTARESTLGNFDDLVVAAQKPNPIVTRLSCWTARNCAAQFSILSPGEKCQSQKGVFEILSFSF